MEKKSAMISKEAVRFIAENFGFGLFVGLHAVCSHYIITDLASRPALDLNCGVDIALAVASVVIIVALLTTGVCIGRYTAWLRGFMAGLSFVVPFSFAFGLMVSFVLGLTGGFVAILTIILTCGLVAFHDHAYPKEA